MKVVVNESLIMSVGIGLCRVNTHYGLPYLILISIEFNKPPVYGEVCSSNE